MICTAHHLPLVSVQKCGDSDGEKRYDFKLFTRIPILRFDVSRASEILRARSARRTSWIRTNNASRMAAGQFKSPGQGPRGQQYGRQAYHGAHAYQGYGPGSYPGTPVHPSQQSQIGMERRMSSAGSEGDSYHQGEESYDYQQQLSDDSRDTQHSLGGDPNQSQGFHGAFGNGAGPPSQQSQPGSNFSSDLGVGGAVGGAGSSGQQQQQQQQLGPPDIKVEALPVPFMSANEFELIEIDPDEEEDI
ncbi:hypothetical protein ElyMa_006650600 [Elysia marginata]|uniref:Uncharacterized protein n=1 Tax=Elysia marginata TaxID=1093978 RepID=A0AAV4IJF9_9GAST|nr:hypothetical protein ElyMa_006650600 [Elysia marginata]